MPLVPGKCPNCGAHLKVEQDNDAAICEYCDTPFIIEKAINNYNTTVNNNYEGANITIVNNKDSEKAENCIVLAKEAYKAEKYEEALAYVNKALELDAKYDQAWYYKMLLAIHYYNNDEKFTYNEITSFALNTLNNISDESKENLEYYVCIDLIQYFNSILNYQIPKIINEKVIKDIKNELECDMKECLDRDVKIITMYWNVVTEISTFLLAIPKESIDNQPEIKTEFKNAILLYFEYINALQTRMTAHKGQHLGDKAFDRAINIISSLHKKLSPEDISDDISLSRIKMIQNYGYQRAQKTSSAKSLSKAIIYALFFGWMGGDKFYLGQKKQGLLRLFFFWTGIPFVISIFTALRFLFMSNVDFEIYCDKL